MILKKAYKLLFLLPFLGCSSQSTNARSVWDAFVGEIPDTDAAFSLYIEKFNHECGVDAEGVPVIFEMPPPPSIGICYFFSGGYREINIHKGYWDASPPGRRQWLIYHELGHCVLGRDHTDDISAEDGFVASIMHSTVPWEAEYLLNKKYEYYILELCGGL